jgi:glycoside/pentoside/hexuronide:cation symporter, GPH family
MSDNNQKLSFFEKAGYSLGDGAANFVFFLMLLFQLNFYTDTLGITAAAAGWLLLVARLWDAFFDPMMGMLADRTETRWGKFRPWVIWTAVPWGVVMVLAYTNPGFNYLGTFLWAFITNVLLMTIYSANNTPYSAMTGVITGDLRERTSLSSYRFVAAMIAQLIVGGFTLPLVAKFGQGDKSKGWQITIGLWAVICVVLFVITFLTTRERIKPISEERPSPKQAFGDLLKNGPWIAIFILTLAHFAVLAMRDGSMSYYFKYYLDRDQLFSFLQGWGLATSSAAGSGGWWNYLLNVFGLMVNTDKTNIGDVGFSLLNITTQLVLVVGVACSTWLAMRYGKKVVAMVGFSFATVLMAAIILVPPDGVWQTFLFVWIRQLTYAPTIPLLWAMFADVADYAEWRTGRRTTGVIFATIIFALKAGLSLGGALAGWILSAYGYQANVAQTPTALLGIRMVVSVYPAICFVIVLICLYFYKIGKDLNIQIATELAERRNIAKPVADAG